MSKRHITRRLTFEAGHRVMGHETKCANLHGHSYKVFVEAEGPLDQIGRIVDFSVLKDRIGGWLDRYWDHGVILYRDDEDLVAALRETGQKLFILPTNPTAENMASFLLHTICPGLFEAGGITVTTIRLQETENCEATETL
jgi:6-pyruvoyltetrahydropterin/6-carboxytetrahydropterin synthase